MVTTATEGPIGIPLTKASEISVGKSRVSPPDVMLSITESDKLGGSTTYTFRFTPAVAEILAADLLEEARRV